MSLSPGTRRGHYDVTSLLGEGTGRRVPRPFGRNTLERVTVHGVLLAVGVGMLVASPSGAQTDPPRTAWGAPDLTGLWNHGTATPLERPERHAGRERLTDEEVAAVNAAARSTEGVGARRAVWWERPLSDGRTAMIVDPPDGRIAYTSAAAARRRAPADPSIDGPEDLNLGARCISSGVPRLGGPYSQNILVVQTPDHVMLLHEMIHEFRIIPLDGRPHVASDVRQWLGDARGRWDGDTLVVETTRFSDQQVFRGLSLETARLIERFTLVDPDTLRYEVTFEDPVNLRRPWTAMLAMPRTEGPMFEYACHEGNYGMTGILEIARGEGTPRADSR